MVKQWITSTKSRIDQRNCSLIRKLLLLLTGCAIISILFFTVLYLGSNAGLDYFFEHSSYLKQTQQKSLNDLQDYVSKHTLTADDNSNLSKWIRKQQVVYLEIYRENRLLYSSVNQDSIVFAEKDDAYYRVPQETLIFADGEAEVVLWGLFGYQFYTYTLIAELLLSFFLFLFLFVFGIKRRIQYIQALYSQIGIMEGGCLEQPIAIQGNDELAELAGALEQLRLSFRQNIRNENALNIANQTLITGIAHDLRTPLTALTMYVQILQSDVCKEEKKKQYYLEKIMSKAALMKTLSDRLFECSQISNSEAEPLEELRTLQGTFMDYLSEMTMYLENQGYQIEAELEWRAISILIRMDYIARIIDNINSNIIKYAELVLPISIKVIYTDHMAGFEVQNHIRIQNTLTESTKVGVKNIKHMVTQMNGTCQIKITQEVYKIRILFPIHDM